jgi:hypothetical protein
MNKAIEKKYSLNQLRGAFGAGVYANQGDCSSENPPVKIVEECFVCQRNTIQNLEEINYHKDGYHWFNVYICSGCGTDWQYFNEEGNKRYNESFKTAN